MILTHAEKGRIAAIRKSLKRFKRYGADTSTWESAFFLGILDKFRIGKPNLNKVHVTIKQEKRNGTKGTQTGSR